MACPFPRVEHLEDQGHVITKSASSSGPCIGPGILLHSPPPGIPPAELAPDVHPPSPKAGPGQLFAVVIDGAAIYITGAGYGLNTSEAVALWKKVCAS